MKPYQYVTLRCVPRVEREEFINVDMRMVGGGYFRAMEIPLVAGRWFDDQDTRELLAKADQLEAGLLILRYKESYRPEFEAWKKAHPNGIRKFVDTWGLQP